MPNLKETSWFCPASPAEWRRWLAENHETEESVWLVLYKKTAPTPNLTWDEAVDEALCFGWIDSIKKTVDKDSYRQYFGKRKANSTWSAVNKVKVDALIDQGRMEDAGLRSIAAAKENGSWHLLDDVEALVMPEDLAKALGPGSAARSFYDGLSKSKKKQLLSWLVFAKRAETRQRRIAEIAACAKKGTLPSGIN